MDKEFWLKRWSDHQIGFHKTEVNKNLIDYFKVLNLKKGDHIFVPLCGKSLDMIWLKNLGLYVTGIELSEIAIQEFFLENGISYIVESCHNFNKYVSDQITIYHGDIFDLTCEELGNIDAIYDRAATIALPHQIRKDYLSTLKKLSTHLTMLIVLLEYDQSLVDGPPFSVSEDYIISQFQNYESRKLSEHKTENVSGKFLEVGAQVLEKVFLIKELA